MRVRLVGFLLVVMAALAPLSGVAASGSAAPVMTGSFTNAEYTHIDGSGCAGLTSFDLESSSAAITATASIFGFTAANPTYVNVYGTYLRTFGGQRIFSVSLDTYSDSDIYESEFYWQGYAALTCLADGSIQVSFKPSYDYYYDQYNPATGYYVEGNLGKTARVTMTLDLANAGASFNVYGPVTLRQTGVHPS